MSHCVVHDTSELPAHRIVASQAAQFNGSDCTPCEPEALLACAALELVTTVIVSDSVEEATTRVVNHLKEFLNADGVAMGTATPGGGCRLAAFAGISEIQAGSELAATISAMLSNVIRNQRSERVVVNSRTAEPTSKNWSSFGGSSTGLREIAATFGDSQINGVRLETKAGVVVGALLVWSANSKFDGARSERFLRLSSEPLAAAFGILCRTKRGRLRNPLGRVLNGRRWLICALLAFIGTGLLFSLPYRVGCDCVAEPLAQRFICAPFEGVFEKSLVRPGDDVVSGQVLGQTDGHDLGIQLAAVTADSERARKSYDVNLASGKVAAAQIDRLELERLEQQKQLIEHRMSNLAIRSPVDGYVIGGDLKHKEGSPLTLGQVLYEIAPRDQMIVELSIDESDIACVEPGQKVAIRFETWGAESLRGSVVRIHPRSEIRDSRNVFVGEVVLEDSIAQLRPGMRGQARIAVEGYSMATAFGRRSWHGLASFFGF